MCVAYLMTGKLQNLRATSSFGSELMLTCADPAFDREQSVGGPLLRRR